ncbi:MAG: ATP-binding protein [Candidatus Methanofastidiosia archaeon]
MNMVKNSKRTREDEFRDFLQSISRGKFREFVSQSSLQELNEFEFKEEMIEWSRLAKSILGMANTKGGSIVFGLKENDDNTINPIGVKKLVDESKVANGINKFLPRTLSWQIMNISFGENDSDFPNKKFQIVFIDDLPGYLPFICESDGKDVSKGRIYVRRNTSTVEADNEEVQELINRRMKAGFEEHELRKHLISLRVLYEQMPNLFAFSIYRGISEISGSPLRGYFEFIEECIVKKKKHIEELL